MRESGMQTFITLHTNTEEEALRISAVMKASFPGDIVPYTGVPEPRSIANGQQVAATHLLVTQEFAAARTLVDRMFDHLLACKIPVGRCPDSERSTNGIYAERFIIG